MWHDELNMTAGVVYRIGNDDRHRHLVSLNVPKPFVFKNAVQLILDDLVKELGVLEEDITIIQVTILKGLEE